MNVNNEAQNLNEAAEVCLSAFGPVRPQLALILGSGLGNFASEILNPVVIKASQIPHYPRSTVEGHAGRLIVGSVEHKGKQSPPILLFQGRIHFYETGTLHPLTFPVKLAHKLGVTHLIVTNAAGGINRSFHPGQFMLITDFLNLTFIKDFPPVSDHVGPSENQSFLPSPFDQAMIDVLQAAAATLGMTLAEGVYCWLRGPTYETAAEIEMLSRCGVDAVGMSTVPEIVEAGRLGINVAGISLISNLATGLSDTKLSHHEVTTIAQQVQAGFISLMKEAIVRMEPLLGKGQPHREGGK